MIRDIRHILVIVLASMLARGAAGAPAAGPERGEWSPLTIKVYDLPKPGDPNITFRAERAVVDAFLAKPENANVQLVPFSGLRATGMSMEVGPLMAIAGGVAPDVLYVNFRKSDSYIQEGFLYPLDEYIIAESKARGIPIDEHHPFRDDEVPELLKDRVPRPVWPVVYRRGPDGEKHVYALPHGTLVIAMMYRKDVFREAGLDPEQPPRTWDEFRDAAVRITDPERGVYGVALVSGKMSSWRLMSFLWSAGAEAIEQDEAGQWRAAFDSDEAVLAVDFYRELCQIPFEKYGKTYEGVAYRDSDLWRLWAEGKIGIFFGYLDAMLLAQANPELTGIAPVPRGPGGESASELNCKMMGLSATTTDPARRQKAWEYVFYYDGQEARRIKTEVYVQSGFGRFVNPVSLREFGYTEYIRQVPKVWLETFEDALERGKPEPYGKNCDLIYHEISRPLEDIVLTDFSGLSDTERRARIKAVLEEAVKDTNEKLLGILPPEVERFRERVALAVASLVVVVFSFVFYRVYRAFTPDWARGRGWEFRRYKWAYALLVPAALTIVLWRYAPLLRGSIIAFQDYKIVHETRFVGLANFAQILFDGQFWMCLWRSTYYMLLSIGLCFWPPIFLAILLQEVPRGKILFRVLFYLPAVTSGLVIAFLWKNFYDPSEHGLLNQLIGVLDAVPAWLGTHVSGLGWLEGWQVGAQKWLGDKKLAMICLILPQLWAGMGPGCIIYLAALKSIPDDFYEAADIDGAGFHHKIAHIVIPYLKPLIIINFIGAFIAAFKSANYVFIMTGGGPADATHVLGFEIFIRSFMYLKFGIGTAMAWILGSCLIGFTGYQLRVLSRLQFKAAGQQEDKG
ncbi:MAG: extracellular solute-binding protein [Candidatus Hydrogenedentes bacterium]|nr:extracellular solute-binding protein [Candidatus Hydrogenedentota bacterium]